VSRAAAVLFWSVVAAAFIGPGTVTACGAAGAEHGTTLLWALTFSGFACFTLQEAAARVSAVSDTTLARAIRLRSRSRTARAASVVLVCGAIVVGCAAYEAGNLLGAVTGLRMASGGPASAWWPWMVAGVGAAGLLASGTARIVARVMGVFVALMGVAFLVTAARLGTPPAAALAGAVIPRVPDGAAFAVLGLVGTTVVPYNLFLGSGLARGQRLGEIRFGLAVAIGLGVVVSMAIVVVGAAVPGSFSFEGIAAALGQRLGGWAPGAFAVGLAAAGFSSAVTAPLAAAITASGLFSRDAAGWGERDRRYRAVWAVVVATGLAFGLVGFRPVPLILAAQALNGILLPFVAAFLWLVVNDRALLGDRVNGAVANAAFAVTVAVAVALGSWGVLRAAAGAVGAPAPSRTAVAAATAVVAVALATTLGPALRRARGSAPPTP